MGPMLYSGHVTSPRQRSARLQATLKRATLVTAGHWPLVPLQFAADAIFKLLVGVAIVGGVLLVGLTLGRDLSDLFADDMRALVATVGETLVDQPIAFIMFVVALLVAMAAGSVVSFLVKGGVVAILVPGEAALADDAGDRHVGLTEVLACSQVSIGRFLDGSGMLFRRYLRLGIFLFATYLVSAMAYLAAMVVAYRVAEMSDSNLVLTLLAALCATVLLIWITLINWCYLLVQMTIALEDCSVRQAARRVATFLDHRFSELFRVFLAVLIAVVIATLVSIVTTAGLGAVSFVPLIGLAAIPLQALAWLVRGLVFQFLGLTALAAYLSVYRQWGADMTSTDVQASEGHSS